MIPESPTPKEDASQPRCSTFLVDDSPSGPDLLGFEGFRPHHELSRALADLIVGEPSAGKAIGLEGQWGSGKSRIIHDLVTELDNLVAVNVPAQPESDKRHPAVTEVRVVVFDSWAHEADPLRRGFVEAVVRQLERSREGSKHKPWIDKARGQEILLELREK
jgi:hypothetical protein